MTDDHKDNYSSESQEYSPNIGRAFNQLTSHTYDTCSYENSLRISSKPMKYFVNQFNSPQSNPFTEFTTVGNQCTWNVSNEFDRALPTRLNELPQVYVLPYSTTPNLGLAAPSMQYPDTSSNLRSSDPPRPKKSAVSLGEIDYNRWSPGVDAATVQMAGAAMGTGRGIDNQGYYDLKAQNNVIFGNGAFPYFGISTRDQLHNEMDTKNC
jgi:hypothetical protein